MKPKTRLQKEVWELHAKLPDPKNHEQFMIKKHDTYFTTHYSKIVCLECGHTWKNHFKLDKKISVKPVCPNCKKKLRNYKEKTNNWYQPEYIRFVQADTFERFQIFRYFSCVKYFEKGSEPSYVFRSLFEEWIDTDKQKSVFIGKTLSSGFINYGDGFSDSEYEVRSGKANNKYLSFGVSTYDVYTSDFNLPKPKFHSYYDKFNIRYPFYNCDLRSMLKGISLEPKIETIYKAGYGPLLFACIHAKFDFKKFWSQIKIAIRHKYKIEDPLLWKDYLNFLSFFGKDLHNPKFILPANLKLEHNRLMNKKRKFEEDERIRRQFKREEEERLKAEADEALRGIKEEVFKDVQFKENEIKIIPLIKEEDVKFEQEHLKHCVYTSKYHLKSGILLMSARIDDKPIETIEISLSNYRVIQCRGYDNEPTEYHDLILRIIDKNINKISRIVEKEKSRLRLETV